MCATQGPNDEKANELLDIFHETMTRLFDGKLYTAPLDKDKIRTALDIGTGTGMLMNLDGPCSFPITALY